MNRLTTSIEVRTPPAADLTAATTRQRTMTPDGSVIAKVEVVTTASGLDALEGEWRHLFAASPAASPTLHFDWVREWWRAYGPVYGLSGRGLRVITVRRGDRLLGTLPLYRRDFWGDEAFEPRRMQFLSAGEAPGDRTEGEYQDLLYLPGEGPCCLAAVEEALLDGRAGSWDLLTLSYVAETSPLHTWAATLAKRRFEVVVSEPRHYSIADLSDGYEAYVARLSPQSRRHARYQVRSAERDGMVLDVAATADDADAFFDDLVRLHQEHWTARGKRGGFASERCTRFHRHICRTHVPTGFALVARLRSAGEVLAVLYGFVVGDKFSLYQSGRVNDRHGHVSSPGTAANLMFMRRLRERGVTRYDFLAGQAFYKDRLTTDYQPFRNIRVWNRTWRVAARTIYGGLKRRLRRLVPGGPPRDGTASSSPAEPNPAYARDGDEQGPAIATETVVN